MTYNRKTKLYRIPKEGSCMGVCAGIADYLDMKVKIVRLFMILGLIFTGFFPLIFVYFILGVALDTKPDPLYDDEQDEEFWKKTRKEPEETSADLRQRFRDIERRTQEMEAYMTSKRFKLEREIDALED